MFARDAFHVEHSMAIDGHEGAPDERNPGEFLRDTRGHRAGVDGSAQYARQGPIDCYQRRRARGSGDRDRLRDDPP